MDTSQQPPQDAVNVLTPQGELVGLPSDQVEAAMQSGYTMAGPEHIEAARAAQAPQQMNMSGAVPGQAEAFAASPMAVDVAKGVEAVGRPYTAEGLAESHMAAVERMRKMQAALKSGDFKSASEPAVEMAMNAGMGLLGSVGAKKPELPSRFSVMTAENPSAIKLSKEQNTRLLNKFKRELEKEGVEFQEVKGKYGSDENSILIPHSDKVNESFVNQLGKKYNQESVIHHADGKNKLRFVSGEKAGMSHRGEGLVEAPNAEDNFTIIGGKKYQMPLDFDKTHPETLVHYSRSEKPLDTIDPAFEGTGSVGKEAARKDRIKRSNYYEIGTEPEDIVAGSSRTVHHVERPENILDLASEEASPLYKRAEEMADFTDDVPTIVEKLAAQSGYAGIKNSNGHNPAHVALFEAHPVSEGKLLAEQTLPAAKSTGLSKEELKLAATAGKLRAGKPSQLTGVGEEIVVDDAGEPIAKLINGNMVKEGGEAVEKKSEGGMIGMAQGGMVPNLKENYSGKKKRKGINYVGYAEGGEVELPSMEQIDQDFAAMQAAPSPYTQQPQQLNAPTQAPQMGVTNVITPTGELVGLPHDQVGEALAQGYRAASDLDVMKHIEQQKYGTPGQQALAGVEGAAEGLLGPIATGAEEGLSRLGVPGIAAEDRVGRASANPTTSGLSEAAGFVIPAIATMGSSVALKGAAKLTQAGLIASAEKGVAKTLGLEATGGFVNQIQHEAVKGAFGAALYQGGQEITDMFNRDPNQTAQSAIADIGLAGILGGVFGGAFGAAANKLNKPPVPMQGTFVSEVDRPAFEAGNFETIIKHSDVLSPKEKEGVLASLMINKKNSSEIKAAADRLGAPALEGILSDAPLVQKAEDALINGAPTYSGIKRSTLYRDAYNTASGAVDGALGEGSKLSKAELGTQLKQSISGRLKEESAPIEELYSGIKSKFEVIPAEEGAIRGAANELRTMRELALSPKSPEGMLLKRAADEIENLKTVDDIKMYKSILSRSVSPTASSGEKRMVGVIGGKLAQLEEDSIVKYAKIAAASDPVAAAGVEHLIAKRVFANAQYKDFIKDVQQLSEQLGKGRVYGLQDALHFINERLTPEEVATRLFAKKDSEFLKFFGSKFPEEMALIKNYQKQALREEASTQGVFSPLKLFNKLNKLEPEIKAQLFDKQELARLADAELYLRNFPKKFNPSGTSEMNAFREFMKSPSGAAMGNARDAAIEAFIKLSSLSPEIANATSLGNSTVKGWNAVSKASKALFDPTREILPSNVISIAAKRDSLRRMVDTYSQDPAKFMEMNDNNPVPEYSSAFSMTGLKAVEYLNSIKPVPERAGLLNQEMPLTQMQKSAYERQLSIAQQPLVVYGHLKHGTLTPDDVTTLRTIYPDLYTKMSNDIMSNLIDAQAKNKIIPYPVKMSLSMFLGQPLDFSMTQAGIQGAQPSEPMQEAPQPGQKMTQKGGAAISKMPNTYETPLQSRAQRSQK